MKRIVSISISILTIITIFSNLIRLCNSQTLPSQKTGNGNSDYKTISINNLFEIQQNYTAASYKLNLTNDSIANYNFIIIDIIIMSYQDIFSKFVACLNFDSDIIKDTTFIEHGTYDCQFTDVFSTQQQKSQHLLVIDAKNAQYSSKKYPYLTVFYTKTPKSQISPPTLLDEPLKFDTFIYYFNQHPCHNNCNGVNGSCNGKTGQCACKQNYMDLDCSVYLYPINLGYNMDSNNLIIQSNKNYYFKIKMDSIIQIAQGNHISFLLRKFKGQSIIDIQMIVNIQQLPTESYLHSAYQMTNDETIIPNVEELCRKYPQIGPVQNATQTGNSTNSSSQNQVDNNCFIILSIRQSLTRESTVLNFTLKIQENQNDQNNNINNNKNDLDLQNKPNNNNQSASQKSQNSETIILISVIAGFTTVLVLGYKLKVFYSRYSQQNVNPRQNNYQENQPRRQQSDIISQINNRIITEKKKKIMLGKKRLLQECLMPVQQFIPITTSKSLNAIDQAEDSSRKKEDVNISIDKGVEKENQNIENQQLEKSIVNIDQNQFASPKNERLFFLGNDMPKQFIQQPDSIDQNQYQNQNLNQNQINEDIQGNHSQNAGQQTIMSSSRNKQCCAICLVEFKRSEIVRQTICMHTFHVNCLSDWLKKNDNCPLCRQSFEIMDMIDYLASYLRSKAIGYDQKLSISSHKNFVESKLQEKQEGIIDLSDEEFLDIFKYFFPVQPEKKKEENDILQSPPFLPLSKNTSEEIKGFKLEDSSINLNGNLPLKKEPQLSLQVNDKFDNNNKKSLSPLKFFFQKKDSPGKNINQIKSQNKLSMQSPPKKNNRSLLPTPQKQSNNPQFDYQPLFENNQKGNPKLQIEASNYRSNNLTELQRDEQQQEINESIGITIYGLDTYPTLQSQQNQALLQKSEYIFQNNVNSNNISLNNSSSKESSFLPLSTKLRESFNPKLDSNKSCHQNPYNPSKIMGQMIQLQIDEIKEATSAINKSVTSLNCMEKSKDIPSKNTQSLQVIQIPKNEINDIVNYENKEQIPQEQSTKNKSTERKQQRKNQQLQKQKNGIKQVN